MKWAVLILLLAQPAFAQQAPLQPFSCAERLRQARTELLAAGFDPAKATPYWLQVHDLKNGGLLLNVYTVYTPDGDGYRTYEAEIHRARRKPRHAWRLVQRQVLDEFKEERLPERTWTRVSAGWAVRIHIRTEERKLVALFERITSQALDDCLEHAADKN